MRRGWAVALLAVSVLTGGTIWALVTERVAIPDTVQRTIAEPISGRSAFDRWLAAEPDRATELAALQAFLDGQGVGDVVPVWTLLRTNGAQTLLCGGDVFSMPPRKYWPNIVPALRLVKTRILPVVGKAEVVSALRTPALNGCSGGAPQSRHLTFSALDMVPVNDATPRDNFAKLCAAWREAGPRSGWGLGAYFDPDKPTQNRVARFHVDGTGWRSWGFTKKSTSSGCNKLQRTHRFTNERRRAIEGQRGTARRQASSQGR